MKRILSIFTLLALATLCFAQNLKNVKYVFLFIGDGMSLPQRMATDEFLRLQGKSTLAMNQLPNQAITRTRSADQFITDSAASGTAISCGVKTNNYYIGIDANGNRVESIAEYAKKCGKKVGIITTVTLTHATPATFYSHTQNRYDYFSVAKDLLKSNFDFFGGGEVFKYTINSRIRGGTIEDFEKLAKNYGYKIVRTRSAINSLKKGDGKIIAVAETDNNLPYVIDEPNSIRISNLLTKGIEMLEDNDKGFFFMIEGGSIDWMCHANDAATTFHEIANLDNAVKVALEFAKKHPDETLIIITGDHETGGMSLGFAGTGYITYLDLLQNQKMSHAMFEITVKKLVKQNNQLPFEVVQKLMSEKLGFKFDAKDKADKMFINEKELAELKKAFAKELELKGESVYDIAVKDLYEKKKNPMPVAVYRCMNNKAGIGWASQAHTALPTLTTATGVNSHLVKGSIDNTDIYKIIKKSIDAQ